MPSNQADHESSVSGPGPKSCYSSSSSSISVPVDRISDLPEPIITNILSSLTTSETVATSVLSRSWRFRWTHVTGFNIDNREGRRSIAQNHRMMDCAEFIDRVLANHNGESIDNFALFWVSTVSRPVNLDRWVDSAIDRNVRFLDLQTHSWLPGAALPCEFPLPPSLYTSGVLEVLRLGGPLLVSPPNEVSFPKLAEMSLESVIYESDDSLSKLVSASPVLHSLAIVRTNMVDNMVVCIINSPVLKHLFIDFNRQGRCSRVGFVKPKLIINAPELEILHLLDRLSWDISIQPPLTSLDVVLFEPNPLYRTTIVEVFQSFCSAKVLALPSGPMTEVIKYRDFIPPLPSFERLAKLVISRPYEYEWSPLMELLDSCTRLEELAVLLKREQHWSVLFRVPRCLFSSLRRLTLAGFNGRVKHMVFLRFFLENSFAMERVDIWYTGFEERSEMLDKVSRLPRVSPACRVSLLDSSEITNSFVCMELAVFPHYDIENCLKRKE